MAAFYDGGCNLFPMSALTSSTSRTLPELTTAPSTTRAGVVITEYAAICAKSVTWSMGSVLPISARARVTDVSSAWHFRHPGPRIYTRASPAAGADMPTWTVSFFFPNSPMMVPLS